MSLSFQFALMRVNSSRSRRPTKEVTMDVSIRADASELLEESTKNIASDQHQRHPFTRHPNFRSI